jgi:phage recombination protein Bet
MNTQTQERTSDTGYAESRGEVATFQKPRLPWNDVIETRFADIGVTKASWKALVEAVFPAAQSVDSVIMALSYCKARKLDPFKRPVHIVPVYDSARRCMVETVWPGISELRTTAMRTGQMAGMDAAEFGDVVEETFTGSVKQNGGWAEASVTLKFPQWCQVTVYRMLAGQRVAFVGPKVYWREAYAGQGKSTVPNSMWQKRPQGQLEKCAEAAALRRAFPEELGNEYAAEEMEGQRFMGLDAHDVTPQKPPRTAAATMDAFAGDPKREAEEAEYEEAEDGPAGGTDHPDPDDEDERQQDDDHGQTNDSAGAVELTDDEMEAASAYAAQSIGQIRAFQNAKALNGWFNSTFLTEAKDRRLSLGQIENVTNERDKKLKSFK